MDDRRQRDSVPLNLRQNAPGSSSGDTAFDRLFRSIQQALPHLFAYLGQVHAILVLRAAESVGIVGSFAHIPRLKRGERAQPQAVALRKTSAAADGYCPRSRRFHLFEIDRLFSLLGALNDANC